MATLKVTNTTVTAVPIDDVGIIIPAGIGSFDSITDPSLIRNLSASQSLRTLVLAGTLTLSDGTNPVTLANLPGFWDGVGFVYPAPLVMAIRTVSGAGPILSTDSIILVNTSGGAFALTLPDPATVIGVVFRIIDKAGTLNTNNLTLTRFAAEMIEGLAASKVFQTNWGGWDIVSDGTNWYIK